MSVIVKGIGMPEGCELCPMYNEDSYYCQLDGRGVWEYRDYRPDWCPLVEVPTPHGRLIDADAFLATIRPICAEDSNAACTFETVKELMKKHITNAPTIIEAEGEESQ